MNDEQERTPRDLGERTKQFAMRVIRLYSSLPRTDVARILGRQLLRAGTSVGAHYREAKRARSHAEFISKIEGALQELDESDHWMELLIDSGIVPAARLALLRKEVNELMAIFVASVRTVKRKQ